MASYVQEHNLEEIKIAEEKYSVNSNSTGDS